MKRRIAGIPTKKTNAILDAFWDQDVLEVIDSSLRRLRVPKGLIPALNRLSIDALKRFEIDSHGSYIRWPAIDVYYDWEHLEWALDPSKELRSPGKPPDFYRRYGSAMRKLREAKGLLQTEIPGLTERQVRRIEAGQHRFMLNSLRKLASAHGVTVAEYVRELNKVWSPN